MYDSTFSELQQANKITENLEHRISLSFKEDTIFLEVRYRGNKFTINKVFNNDFEGREELEKQIESFNTEEKVKTHFNI
jgi:hypothetical protein